MDDWSEEVKEIITQHKKRKDDIENIFMNILSVSKIGIRCVFEITNQDKLIWDISIGLKTFTLTNEEILKGQEVEGEDEHGFSIVLNDEKKDLEEVIKKLILKKIQ